MKSKISRNSFDPSKRYSGVYQQQGSLITDADWNEMQDVIRSYVETAVWDIVGSGVSCRSARRGHLSPPVEGITLNSGNDDFTLGYDIRHIYVNGRVVHLPGMGIVEYTNQPDYPNAPKHILVEGDHIYLDVWDREVLTTEEQNLTDSGFDYAETCIRSQRMAQVKIAPSGTQFVRGNSTMTVRARDQAARTIEHGPIDFVFRLEVHDVTDLSDGKIGLTLKWSTENGAECHRLKNPLDPSRNPLADSNFTDGDWCFEFGSTISEQHLGQHLVELKGKCPIRSELTRTLPALADEKWEFVRRWDGYCRLVCEMNHGKVKWTLDSTDPGRDHRTELKLANDPSMDEHGAVQLPDLHSMEMKVHLSLFSIALRLNSYQSEDMLIPVPSTFLPGDYWLATIRQGAAESNEPIPLSGIIHDYLEIGKIEKDSAGKLRVRLCEKFDNLTSLTSRVSKIEQMSLPDLEIIAQQAVLYVGPFCVNQPESTVVILEKMPIAAWYVIDSGNLPAGSKIRAPIAFTSIPVKIDSKEFYCAQIMYPNKGNMQVEFLVTNVAAGDKGALKVDSKVGFAWLEEEISVKSPWVSRGTAYAHNQGDYAAMVDIVAHLINPCSKDISNLQLSISYTDAGPSDTGQPIKGIGKIKLKNSSGAIVELDNFSVKTNGSTVEVIPTEALVDLGGFSIKTIECTVEVLASVVDEKNSLTFFMSARLPGIKEQILTVNQSE